jgi:hypothetical protein
MEWTQEITCEYVDVVPGPRPPVKKQMWNGVEFVPILTYRLDRTEFSREQYTWLEKTFGHKGVQQAGQYWDYSRAGTFVVMDEKVYVMFQLKWSGR